MTDDINSIPLKRIDGTSTSLGDFDGRVRLVVNVASKCGLTPQYEGLEALYRRYNDRGFEVLGFPANDFGAQEPGSNDEIADFCTTNFGVDFPMFEKIAVTGPDRHPLYDALVEAQPTATSASGSDFKTKLAGYGITPKNETDVLWNFEKFVVGRDGTVVARFAPQHRPRFADPHRGDREGAGLRKVLPGSRLRPLPGGIACTSRDTSGSVRRRR